MMNEFVEYVAGADENEARWRFEAGLGRETQRDAERDADARNRTDKCDPPCHNIVWRVRTTLEPM